MSAVLPNRQEMGMQRKTQKCPFAAESLEAATGVEPVMEVLQSSGAVSEPRNLAETGYCEIIQPFMVGLGKKDGFLQVLYRAMTREPPHDAQQITPSRMQSHTTLRPLRTATRRHRRRSRRHRVGP
jgi:hypothetical protein